MAQYSFYANTTGAETAIIPGDFEVRIVSIEWINASADTYTAFVYRYPNGFSSGGSTITVAPIDGRSPPPSTTVKSGSLSFSGSHQQLAKVYVGTFSKDFTILKDLGHGSFQPPLDLTAAPGEALFIGGEIIVFFEEMRLSQSR